MRKISSRLRECRKRFIGKQIPSSGECKTDIREPEQLLDSKGSFTGRFVEEILDSGNRFCRTFVFYQESSDTFTIATVYHIIPFEEQNLSLQSTGAGTGAGLGGNFFKDHSGVCVEEANIQRVKFGSLLLAEVSLYYYYYYY